MALSESRFKEFLTSEEDESTATKHIFADVIKRKWLRNLDNQTVLVDTDLSDVAVQTNSTLNIRVVDSGDEISWTWAFEVVSKGIKHLTNVSLSTNNYTEYFHINSVYGESLCYTDGTLKEYVAPLESYVTDTTPSVRTYLVVIKFKAHGTGTYCQDVYFGFNEGPVIRRQLCFDCTNREDMVRLEAAHEYLRYLGQKQAHMKKTVTVPFESSLVQKRDPKEDKICEAYPKPDLDTFFLTHNTLKDNGLDQKNYRRRLHELVTIEEMARREQIARYNEITELRLTNNYILASDTDGSTLAKYAAPGELFAQLPMGREISEDTKSGRLLLRSCNSLLVQKITFDDGPNSPPVLKDRIFEANIEDKCNHMIYARLSQKCVQHLNLQAESTVKMYVQFVMNRLPFCEWHRAIDSLPDTKLVFPPPKLDKGIPFKCEWSSDWTVTLDNCHLNDRQKEAVAVMMTPSADSIPPILILGPFGTGKTSTIAHALRILLVNDENTRVILCTHSNSAADLYVKEFFDVWYKETRDARLKPLRVYYKGRVKTTVHPIVREYCPSDSNGYFRDPTSADLTGCRLVISTLATSSCLQSLEFKPTHIIIDEAAQALECEALACLTLAKDDTRLILAGDQMQLAPEVYSDLARERGLGMSLLERIHLIYQPRHQCRIQLCKNYRAHSDIVKLMSDLFYGGEIEPGAVLPRHPMYSPLTFYACEGVANQGSNSTGFYNNVEAYEIADRVAELRKSWPVEQWGPFGEGSIGVLSHYAEQVLRIRNELRKRRLFNVSVERVLNVQGKQFTAVFISIVRTRHCSREHAERNLSDYGFLTNPRLLNTAITRAKSLVAVVGDPLALLNIGTCNSHWRRYLGNASVHGITPEELNYHLSRTPEPSSGPTLNPLAKEFVPRHGSQNPYWVEYVSMPISCPVIHCAVDTKLLS